MDNFITKYDTKYEIVEFNIVDEKVDKVIMTRKPQPNRYVWKKVRPWVLLVCIWLTYDYEIKLRRIKDANYFKDEIEINFLILVNLRIFCYFFFSYASNFRYSKIFKILSFVEIFGQNFNYIYLYNCLTLVLNIGETLVNVDELLLRFIEIYLFNPVFLFCRKNFFRTEVIKRDFILFENYILKVDTVSFFFLDKFNESYRRFKYNEYLCTHPFVKDKWFKKCFLRFIYLNKEYKARFFTDLRNLYDWSLLNKKIFVFFFFAKVFGFYIHKHPLVFCNVVQNSGILDKFKLKKNTEFYRFTTLLFLRENVFYMKYFFFKIFMRYYRRYWMEEWFYTHFVEIYSNIIRINFNFFDLGLKVANFFEKDFLKRHVLKLNLTHFYIFFDLSNYNFLDRFSKIYFRENLNFYRVITAVFCDYFGEILVDVGYSFDEMGVIQFVRFFDEFFVEGLFDFYYAKNFSTIFDYFCWRISNVDFGWDKRLFSFIKNSSFDWIFFSRYVSVLNYFRKLHRDSYSKKLLFNVRKIISLYVYRDTILKMAFSSYFLVILYFFLVNHQKIFKNFFFVFKKKVKRDLINRVSQSIILDLAKE